MQPWKLLVPEVLLGLALMALTQAQVMVLLSELLALGPVLVLACWPRVLLVHLLA